MRVDLGRLGFAALLAGLGVLGFSMLHDDRDLERRAAEVACRGRVCDTVLRKKHRDLFGWTFTFATYGADTLAVDVTCTRGLWVVGDFRCDVSEIDHAADSRFEHP